MRCVSDRGTKSKETATAANGAAVQQQLGQPEDGREDLLSKYLKATKTTATTTERILKKAKKSKKIPKPTGMIT